MPTVNGFNTTQGILKYNAEKLENYNTPEFSSSTTYSFGDYTIHDGKLYKYTSNIPSSGNWNISNWTFIVLTDEIKTLFNDVSNIENNIPEASDTNPLMDGIVSAGVSDNFSRADHVHPKDTSKQDTLTFDNTPVQNSTNPVTSGGVYTALSGKQDTLTFDNTPIKDSDNPVKSSGIYESILNLYPIDTASGSIASFSDGADDVPVKSIVCNIEPVQSGSGDPSPDNVRPISGFTGLNVYGESEYDPTADPKVAVTWQSEAGTVYAGYLSIDKDGNVTLTVTHSIANLSDIGWSSDSNRAGVFYGSISERKTSSPISLCSVYSLHNGGVTVNKDFYISGQPSYGGAAIFIRDTRFTGYTKAQVQAALTGETCIYELATPVTYTLSSVTVPSTVQGENNWWHNANGETSVIYRADPTLFVNTKIMQAVSSALNT